ncbi:hypothetical protein EJK54_2098 [Moraxella catarrhalis]|uniref:Uncharacterized protein n=1 Tax=Moraxella catarrhalis TaxID=480 RepID=A0ABY0BLI7_MORCA|nr:hypothetical protein EJK54_2098 [Moraxella catarrhalis]
MILNHDIRYTVVINRTKSSFDAVFFIKKEYNRPNLLLIT